MRTMLSSLAALALALTPAACSKDKDKGTPSQLPSDEEVQVGPPKAGDLAGYVKDLSGSGKLKVTIDTTEGSITCELYEKQVPMTVANFVGLARGLKPWRHPRTRKTHTNKPYFDGIIFHRVIPRFMVQTGDPLGKGMYGPGYSFADEFHPDLMHDRPGILSMANSGPGTNGSQFFITETPQPGLNNKHSVFGHCDKGIDVVKTIARLPAGAANRPLREASIVKMSFFRE